MAWYNATRTVHSKLRRNLIEKIVLVQKENFYCGIIKGWLREGFFWLVDKFSPQKKEEELSKKYWKGWKDAYTGSIHGCIHRQHTRAAYTDSIHGCIHGQHTRMHTRAAGKMTVKTLATSTQNHPVLVFTLKHIRCKIHKGITCNIICVGYEAVLADNWFVRVTYQYSLC